jgi:hypothetical protein
MNVSTATNIASSNMTMAGLGAAVKTTISTSASVALKCFKFYTLYSMYESALSDILCLKTFRHGTNLYAVASITLTGPNHDLAGVGGEAAYLKTTTGTTSAWAARDQALKAFYVAEDVCTNNMASDSFFNYISTKMTVKYYALLSSAQFFGSMLPLPQSWKANLIAGTVAVIQSDPRIAVLGLLCPSVKFHMNPDEVQLNERAYQQVENKINFYRDTPDAGEGALYTKYQFSVLDIGILGVLKNGINRNIFTRINENQGQFLWGVAQLVTAVAFTAFFFPEIVPGGAAVVAGVTAVVALGRFGELGVYAALAILGTPLVYAGFQI